MQERSRESQKIKWNPCHQALRSFLRWRMQNLLFDYRVLFWRKFRNVSRKKSQTLWRKNYPNNIWNSSWSKGASWEEYHSFWYQTLERVIYWKWLYQTMWPRVCCTQIEFWPITSSRRRLNVWVLRSRVI